MSGDLSETSDRPETGATPYPIRRAHRYGSDHLVNSSGTSTSGLGFYASLRRTPTNLQGKNYSWFFLQHLPYHIQMIIHPRLALYPRMLREAASSIFVFILWIPMKISLLLPSAAYASIREAFCNCLAESAVIIVDILRVLTTLTALAVSQSPELYDIDPYSLPVSTSNGNKPSLGVCPTVR